VLEVVLVTVVVLVVVVLVVVRQPLPTRKSGCGRTVPGGPERPRLAQLHVQRFGSAKATKKSRCQPPS
jgi:hypothetical protein